MSAFLKSQPEIQIRKLLSLSIILFKSLLLWLLCGCIKELFSIFKLFRPTLENYFFSKGNVILSHFRSVYVSPSYTIYSHELSITNT